MQRKILNNYKKQKRLSGSSKGKVGTVLPIQDRSGKNICIGDHIKWGSYTGIVLFNPSSNQYGLALSYSMWYGDDLYNIDSYGKFIDLPMDNGAKMELEVMTR